MDFESARRELYGLAPGAFTAARDAKVSEARAAHCRELAASLKALRKPSVGAWLANRLVVEHWEDVERLLALGAELRAPARDLEGEDIRRVSKEKADTVTKLVRDAGAMASRFGQPVSAAAGQELEATLEAAFADPQAAESLREGRLVSGLHYSGLGLAAPSGAGSPTPRARGSRAGGSPRSRADRATARRDLEKAHREVERAEAEVAKATRAVAVAADELKRRKAAEALAKRRSREARDRASAAKKKLGTPR